MPTPLAPPVAGTNLSVVVGTIAREPATRTLPSGDLVVALEVRVEGPAAATVPVSWSGDLPAGCDQGVEVLVVGAVRRRFFRAGGATQSRTELVAAAIVPTRQRARAARALAAAVEVVAAA